MVARSELRGAGDAGIVFFLTTAGSAGAVAVGAAHSFDRTRLAEVGEIAFLPAGGSHPLAVSRRYFARPGRAFHAPGATLRDDFLVFALEAPPQDVRLLEPAVELPQPGARVRIPGIAALPAPHETLLAGTVVESGPSAIEVELDAAADLRGWGGAPVLSAEGDVVIGLLQAAWPSGNLTRTRVGPIAGVREAMAAPYEAGLGRLFATLAPQPSAANSLLDRGRAATGTPYGDLPPDLTAARLDAALRSAIPPPAPGASGVQIRIESPAPETIFGDAAGAFVAGRALAQRSATGGTGRFDIVLVIDTSGSTGMPSGSDVDGDGQRGVAGFGADLASSDRGDSILAAEIAGAEQIVAGLDPNRTRVGIVTFAGESLQGIGDPFRPPVRLAALVQEPLTSDFRRVRDALAELSRVEPRGETHMAAGIDRAMLELLGLAGSVGSTDPESTKMLLFFTDGRPNLPYPASELGSVAEVNVSATRARRAGVRIHSFAVGPEALAGPLAAVEMAEITQGIFTAVREPGRLSEVVDQVRFAAIDAIEVRNATSGADAHEVRMHADGSWEALVPLVVGKNRLEVTARSIEGAEASETVLVHYAPGSVRGILPAELVGRFNRLLQSRLLTLGAERREATRRELILEIEGERARALERAAAQRKELELRAAPPGS